MSSSSSAAAAVVVVVVIVVGLVVLCLQEEPKLIQHKNKNKTGERKRKCNIFSNSPVTLKIDDVHQSGINV